MSNKKKYNTKCTSKLLKVSAPLRTIIFIILLNLSVLYVEISLLKGKLVIVMELTYFHDC